ANSTSQTDYIICSAVRSVCRRFEANETVMRFAGLGRQAKKQVTGQPSRPGTGSARTGRSVQGEARPHPRCAPGNADGKLAGTVVLAARRGRLISADAPGFQDKDEGKPMALDSIFRIYSMTKPLVSVAAMMLVEDGKIELTDPVSKFFPAFKGQQVSVARSDNELAPMSYTTVADPH